jgi:DNA adenine methylase
MSITTQYTFGEKLRKIREDNGMPLRKLAALLDIDQSTLSKIERNERKGNPMLIDKISKIFKTDKNEFQISYVSDKIAFELLKEEYSLDILKVAEEKIAYVKKIMLNTAPSLNRVGFNKDQSLFPVPTIQKPFLKWAGGKTQLIPSLLKFLPKQFNKYIEPFIGGGALFFNLNHPFSIIADLNEELVITYQQVKEDISNVLLVLDGYANTEEFYYKIRAITPSSLSNTERAARLIFLNKTCFNGLFRVNKKGEFNVPYGKRKGHFINRENLLSASAFLQNTEIYHMDYKDTVKNFARKGDFIYLDPPYQPVGKYSDFKRYTKEFFYEKDQIELANVFKELVSLGCFVMLTNSDHPFILELYKDYHLEIIETKRLISSNPSTRTGKDIIVLGGI